MRETWVTVGISSKKNRSLKNVISGFYSDYCSAIVQRDFTPSPVYPDAMVKLELAARASTVSVEVVQENSIVNVTLTKTSERKSYIAVGNKLQDEEDLVDDVLSTLSILGVDDAECTVLASSNGYEYDL